MCMKGVYSGVQTFDHQTFNHPTLNHGSVRVRDETLSHVRVRTIDSSSLAMLSCYTVYVIKCLVMK